MKHRRITETVQATQRHETDVAHARPVLEALLSAGWTASDCTQTAFSDWLVALSGSQRPVACGFS